MALWASAICFSNSEARSGTTAMRLNEMYDEAALDIRAEIIGLTAWVHDTPSGILPGREEASFVQRKFLIVFVRR